MHKGCTILPCYYAIDRLERFHYRETDKDCNDNESGCLREYALQTNVYLVSQHLFPGLSSLFTIS